MVDFAPLSGTSSATRALTTVPSEVVARTVGSAAPSCRSRSRAAGTALLMACAPWLPPSTKRPCSRVARIASSGADPRALWDRTAISHLSYRGREGLSAVHAGWKLIHPQTRSLAAGPLLFQLTEDPAEGVNRAGDAPVRAAWLRSLLRREEERGRSGLKAQTDVMDAETRKALEALGYL